MPPTLEMSSLGILYWVTLQISSVATFSVGVQIIIRIKDKVVEVDDPQDDPPSSGEENTVEVSKKTDPLETYPPKLGQITVAVHISIARAKMCQNICEREAHQGGTQRWWDVYTSTKWWYPFW